VCVPCGGVHLRGCLAICATYGVWFEQRFALIDMARRTERMICGVHFFCSQKGAPENQEICCSSLG